MPKPTRYTLKLTVVVEDAGDGNLPCQATIDWSATNQQDYRKHEGEMLAWGVSTLQRQPAYRKFMADDDADYTIKPAEPVAP